MDDSADNSDVESAGPIPATLEAVFGSRAETRILAYLAVTESEHNPQRQYDIADAIGMSEATVSRTIQKFADLGIVAQTDEGVRLDNEAVAMALIDIVAAVDARQELLSEGFFEPGAEMGADDPSYSVSAGTGSPNPTG